MSTPRIRVLIVDDSAVVRQTLSEVLSSDPEIDVMGTAADPFVATERMREEVPDVITLDIEMPRMDGLTFLQKIMSQHPIPVVICSSLAEEGAQSTLKALEYGAVDIITKPPGQQTVSGGFADRPLPGCQGCGRGAIERAPATPRCRAQADRGCHPLPCHPCHGRDNGEGGGHRRLDRGNRGA